MLLCDVTLREGDQMPGSDYSVAQKVGAGRALDDLGVSYMQTGFPITGDRDRETTRRLTGEVSAETIGLARAIPDDIDAVCDAEADIAEVILPLSDRHLEHSLGKTREEALDMAETALTHADDRGVTAHITLIDAFRTDIEHLVDFFERFRHPEYINLADTVGARTPKTVRETLASLEESVDFDRVGVHFHDDLGVGVANTLTAYEAGVAKADVSVASLGERAGNTSLEEVVVAGVTEHDEDFGVDSRRVIPVCERVLDALGESVEPRKPVLGEAVSTHESGLHTAAMLHDPSVFEPFSPSRFGGERRLLFGSATGRQSARILLERADSEPTDERIHELLSALDEEGPLGLEEALALAGERR
ncbi:MAG TPA: citramalate synthase [Halococcus sp.]|nr:citramalate synthase [Halococcus sp.]